MRLQNGTDASNGRVEICRNGIWHSVCNTSWDHTDAGVLCTQLRYNIEGTQPTMKKSIYCNSILLSTKMWKLQVCLDLENLC